MRDAEIFTVMTVPADPVTAEQAEAVALSHWGIRAQARLLTGERDRNFRLTAADGQAFVLKFANPAEAQAVTDLQVQALLHVARTDPDFPIPRMIRLPDGAIERHLPRADGTVMRVRLLSWVHGATLREVPRSARQRVNCGAALARLGLALADFRHPASGHALIWDLKHALRLREVLAALEHRAAEAAIAGLLDRVEAEVMPALPRLRQQVLYNDMNQGNTLVDPADPDRLVGIIDFGDLVHTAIAIDAATGGVAHIGCDMAVADGLAHYIAGYHAVRPLLAEEVAVLPLLTATRLAMSLVLQAWHRSTHPDNPHYARMTEAEIVRRLGFIAATCAPETGAALRRACGQS